MVKNSPAMEETQEMQVQSLGKNDPLETEMATHSRILAWRIPWTKEPGGLQSTDNKESDMTEHAPPPPPPRAYEHKVDFHLHMHIWETLKSLKSALEG